MLLVMPQATRRLRPKMMPGAPAYPEPATLYRPPTRCTWYQQQGEPKAMCGSLATMPPPDALRLGPTTQLLLPVQSSTPPSCGSKASMPLPALGYSPGCKIVSSIASAVMKARYSGPSPRTRRATSGMAITGNRPVRYQRNSPSSAMESSGRQGSGR